LIEVLNEGGDIADLPIFENTIILVELPIHLVKLIDLGVDAVLS
jgi:hypothetical protein